MKDKELRKLIGSRAKQRRLESGVNQPYIAEKMGVTASTIQRYEAGTIDNTKKLVLEDVYKRQRIRICTGCIIPTFMRRLRNRRKKKQCCSDNR